MTGLAARRSAPICFFGTSAEEVDERLGHREAVALVSHGQEVARAGHVDDRLDLARLVGVRTYVPTRRGARRPQEPHQVAAGALAPGADLVGVDVELVGVGPKVADGALHIDDLVGPVGARSQAIIDADHHKAVRGQVGTDFLDQEAPGVEIARDPGSSVDVDGRGGGAVEGGRFADVGFFVVAVGDGRLLPCAERRGRRRAGGLRGRGAGAGSGGAGGEADQGERADKSGGEGSAHGSLCWPNGR